jgi:pimeloyl-ACP methyl ester carboxylesterase
MQQLLFPNNIQFWYETLRSMSHIAYGGADFGEVVSTGERITEGDYASWYTEWIATADRVSDEARKALEAGHKVSARDGFLRASNYYRSAEFFLHGKECDPRHDHAYDRSVECFKAAAALYTTPRIEPVEIPYENTTLPGYMYRVDGSGTPRPTLIMHNGFDGTAEELHFFGAMAGVERGYNVLVFDGPGMPGPRHHQNMVFRPDWENVVTPVVDFAQTLPDIDNHRIALLGVSMGGILAPRAAAFEHRLAALIAVDGLYDLGQTSVRNIPGTRQEAEQLLRAKAAPELDAAFEQIMAKDPIARWAVNHGMYVMGVDTPAPSTPPTSTTPSPTASPRRSSAPPSSATPRRTCSSRASPSSSTTTSPAPRPSWSSPPRKAREPTATPAPCAWPWHASTTGSTTPSTPTPTPEVPPTRRHHAPGEFQSTPRSSLPAKAVTEVDNAVSESALVEELEVGAHAGRQPRLAPADDYGQHQQPALVDQPGLESLGREVGSSDEEIAVGRGLQFAYCGGVESAFEAGVGR